jgi:protease IV
MKQFFKFMFASMLGTFLLMLLFSVIGIGIIAAIVASAAGDETAIGANTLLYLKLGKEIADRGSNTPLAMGFSGPEKIMGLNDILNDLEKASRDKNIAGIYLDLSEMPAGISTVNEIRDGILSFRKSGKFVWAYSEAYTQKTYFLATAADKIFLNPEGAVDFKDLSAEMVFLKGMLDKLDIKMQIIRHGKFKSAAEPLFLDKMSPENREQITAVITDIWDTMLKAVSETRRIDRTTLDRIADSLKLTNAQEALNYKFVDQLVYKDEILGLLKKQMKIEGKKKIETVAPEDYISVKDAKKPYTGNDKIAVIYASGSIGSGEGDDRSIGSERISKAIRKAREDDKVKAIVFRVNSGGGSALASDVIWREIDLAKNLKPVVASFGDVAGSGGYYVACAATKILADPTTITGSIGVFGIIPNMEGLFNKKLGITFDRAMTNANSDYISALKPLPPYQAMIIQRDVDHIYDVFTSKVAAGRKLSKEQVDSIGQGRIWSGADAKSIGLIDDYGGLTKAVDLAADLAKLKEYRLVSLPEQKEWFQELIDQISGKDPSMQLRKALGQDYRLYQYVMEVRQMSGVQARMLEEVEIR